MPVLTTYFMQSHRWTVTHNRPAARFTVRYHSTAFGSAVINCQLSGHVPPPGQTGIVFSLSIHLFTNLWTQYFENKRANFDAQVVHAARAWNIFVSHFCGSRGQSSKSHEEASVSIADTTTRRPPFGDCTFPVAAARAWNSMPLETWGCSSLLTFRRETKSHLFRQSYGWHL